MSSHIPLGQGRLRFSELVDEMGLVEPFQARAVSDSGSEFAYSDLYRIDETKLNALPGAKVKALMGVGALARKLARQPIVAGLVEHDAAHAFPEIQIHFLRHEADAGLGGLELAIDVVAEHLDRAAGLVDERADNADRRRLAGAVRAEQRIEVARLD